MSVYCDTAQALVLLLVSVYRDVAQALVLLLVSVYRDAAQALVLLLVSVYRDAAQGKEDRHKDNEEGGESGLQSTKPEVTTYSKTEHRHYAGMWRRISVKDCRKQQIIAQFSDWRGL